jgi:hypothetical protein
VTARFFGVGVRRFFRLFTPDATLQRRIRIVDSCGDVFSDPGATPGASTIFFRGASPLELPYTRSRSPLRRLPPCAWLASLRSLAPFAWWFASRLRAEHSGPPQMPGAFQRTGEPPRQRGESGSGRLWAHSRARTIRIARRRCRLSTSTSFDSSPIISPHRRAEAWAPHARRIELSAGPLDERSEVGVAQHLIQSSIKKGATARSAVAR